MTALPIAFETNEPKYSFAGEAKLINAYAEKQGNDAKGKLMALPCYGMTLFASVTDTPGRGAIYLDDLDCIYSVHSTSVYKVISDGTATRVGTLPGNDTVQISRNQAEAVQISIHCEAGEFYIENDIVKQVTDDDLPDGVVSQDHHGGYTTYLLEDRRFFISSLNECQTIDGLDYATAEQSADPAVRIKSDGDLFIFKRRQVEQWRDTGNADFPFEPLPSPIRHGLLAAEAVASVDNTLVFVGDDSVVYRIVGAGNVSRISTHGVERKITNDENQSDLNAFSYAAEGHSFANLTGADWSRCYDAATQWWHSRESYQLGKWRAKSPVRAWGKTIVQDALSGNLYFLDKDSFVEGDYPMIWGVDTPILNVFPNGATIDALHIDVATGVGNRTGEGTAPKLMLSWSVNGGRTWKGNRELSLGAAGVNTRVTTRNLGRFGKDGVTFRIRVSDPVIRGLVGLDVQLRKLKAA
jgi:hypothetical protein